MLGGMNDETALEQLKRAERRLAEIRDTLQKRIAEKGALMTARVEKTHHPGIYRRGSRYVVTYRGDRGRPRRSRRADAGRGSTAESGPHC